MSLYVGRLANSREKLPLVIALTMLSAPFRTMKSRSSPNNPSPGGVEGEIGRGCSNKSRPDPRTQAEMPPAMIPRRTTEKQNQSPSIPQRAQVVSDASLGRIASMLRLSRIFCRIGIVDPGMWVRWATMTVAGVVTRRLTSCEWTVELGVFAHHLWNSRATCPVC